MSLKALIVDDEPLARESLRLLLSRHDDVEIVGEAANGRDALVLLRGSRPDLLFLDVQMPGMSGLDLLREAGPLQATAVVFVTAFDRYAIEAFERRALDYLLKPFTDERFETVLARAKRHVKERTLAELGERVLDMLGEPVERMPRAANVRTSLLIKDGKRTIEIPAADIHWIEATDYYARIHTASGSHLIRESLKSLEQTLETSTFARVHRSALVNLRHVREVVTEQSGDGSAALDSGQRVRVSRSFRSSLLSRLSLQRSSPR